MAVTVVAARQQLGQAEVEDFHGDIFGDENVRGLDIAVDDALRVRRREHLEQRMIIVILRPHASDNPPKTSAPRIAPTPPL